jgi:putative glycosyltransferase
MMLSIVTSVYKTAQFLDDFEARAGAAAHTCGLDDYEMIFVIDGSPDDAASRLRAIKARNPRVRVVELSRNFGHHPALWCGLERSRGDLVFLADSDLETAPEVLGELLAALHGNDAAFACRAEQRRWTSRAFWGIFQVLAELPVSANMLTERLMRRPYVDALLQMNDRTLFLGGMMAWIGFRQTAVPVKRTCRSGPPSYRWWQRFALAFDALTSFSVAPLKALFAAGVALAAVSLAVGVALIAVKLAQPAYIVQGFTALAVLLLFSVGSILGAIGLVGLYLGKVFLQTKARPIYIVREEF